MEQTLKNEVCQLIIDIDNEEEKKSSEFNDAIDFKDLKKLQGFLKTAKEMKDYKTLQLIQNFYRNQI